jgi:ribonuclease HI
MAKSKGPKYYAVAVGRVTGVYSTWEECKVQTSGYSGAIFKSFSTSHEAQAFLIANSVAASSNVAIAPSLSGIASHERRKRSHDDEEEDGASSSFASQRKKATPLKADSATISITIHFDGGSRGNPGLAGAGAEVVVTNNLATANDTRTTTYLIREYIGENATNNYAEYKGLIFGLRKAKSYIAQWSDFNVLKSQGRLRLQVYGDSNLIIQQLRGTWQCKHPNLIRLFEDSQRLIDEIKQCASQECNLRCDISFDHVYREHNKVADALANEAMDQRKSWTTTISDDGDISDDVFYDSKDKSNVCDDLQNKSTYSLPVKQEREHRNKDISGVIDVDDSDEESHHSC